MRKIGINIIMGNNEKNGKKRGNVWKGRVSVVARKEGNPDKEYMRRHTFLRTSAICETLS